MSDDSTQNYSGDLDQDTDVLTDITTTLDETTAVDTTVKPVVAAAPNVIVFSDETMVSELPAQSAIEAMVERQFLLPGRAAGEFHELTPLQMGVIASYIGQHVRDDSDVDDNSWGMSDNLKKVAAILRKRFIRGNQKDWNIVSGISAESRNATKHEDMTDAQMAMLYATILPALSGERDHFDPQISAKIKSKPQAFRNQLINEILKLKTRGDVTIFMFKFNGLYGRPQRQTAGASTFQNQAPADSEGTEEVF